MVDWSSLLTQTLVDLTKAEEELRLQHMGKYHKETARTYIWSAQATLLQLDEWCKEVKDENV